MSSDTTEAKPPSRESLVIAMASDFFFPGLGGIEMHIYQLSQCLIRLGYKVIVMTHYRGRRHGVRYMTNDICHGHQATSNFAHYAMAYARTMGITTVFTDHSLFGFGDAACIHINKVLKYMISDVPHAICVSNTNKENLILRAAIRPEDVSVIPNAVDTSRFVPDESQRPPPPRINIVVISRMTYRKGVDLLIDIIPAICNQYPHVHWLIGGDGPKFLDLEQLVERNKLHDRVELLGRVEHAHVRDVLVKGHIFLNCSLTEAFCIAIVEAASCGLCVVSTNVGGIPEVLPSHLIRLADPRADTLTDALTDAIENDIPVNNPSFVHEQLKSMYSWHDVAIRTQKVYEIARNTPRLCLKDRIRIYLTVGPIAGIAAMIYALSDYLIWLLLEIIYPRYDIEESVNFLPQ